MRNTIMSAAIAASVLATSMPAAAATFTCYGRAFNLIQGGASLIGGWQYFENGRSPAILVNDTGSGPFSITDTAGKNSSTQKYADMGTTTMVSSIGNMNAAQLAQRKSGGHTDSFYFQNNYENLREFVFFRSVDGEAKNGWLSTQSYGKCFR